MLEFALLRLHPIWALKRTSDMPALIRRIRLPLTAGCSLQM